jgi:hypothetical protein
LPDFGEQEMKKMIEDAIRKELRIDGQIGSILANVGRDMSKLEGKVNKLAEDLENHVKAQHR